MRTKLLVTALAALCMPVVASADVAWSNSSGSAESFSWANGRNSDSNLFGSPTWFGGNTLYFTNSNFPAAASDSRSSDTVTDVLDVDLTAGENQKFLSIEIFEYGNYAITGGASNTVSAELNMTGTVAGHGMSPFTDGFLFSASGDSAGTVPWNSSAELLLQFAVPDVSHLHLSVSNTLVAVSDGAGGTAEITGNFVSLGISATLIPEPSCLSLLAFGALAVLRRRR
ncbi:MAG TPA: PEP-CTERM sorting domain-containing protein [Phycisphaerae bacterium]|nr:PEP-CTERM sorting domain-containing protein [Phycisphaerae bacterium]